MPHTDDSQRIHCDAQTVEWVKAAEDDGKDAKPAKFKMRAYTGGPMNVGYYGSPVVIDLAGLKAEAPLPILLDHDPSRIVGHAEEVNVTATSIDLAGLVSGGGAESDQVVASSKLGFPWKASVGAMPDKMEFVGEGVTTKVNGREYKGPLYVARKATLGEVSFVALAADRKTSAKVSARAHFPSERNTTMEFDAWVKAKGFDSATLTDEQTKTLRAAFDAEQPAEPAKPVKATEKKDAPKKFNLRGAVLACEKGLAAIQAKAQTYAQKMDAAKHSEIRAKAETDAANLKVSAINDQWSPDKVELEITKIDAAMERDLIRAERPAAPAVHGSSHDVPDEAIQAAFCRTARMPQADVEKQFKPEVLEAADRMRGFGLQELLLAHARRNGYTGRERISTGNLREVLQAGFSTHSLTTMLTNLGHKLLLSGFNAQPQKWREVAAVRSVSDFKTMSAFRLTASLEYEEVPASGAIPHGTLGQETYTYSADTYGKMLAITRKDIINDDLGAFNDIRNRLGIGAALKINKVFWTVWLAAANAAATWTAARGNLVTGSAFGDTGIASAVAAFRTMAAPDGGMMDLDPVKVLVPPELEPTALKYYKSAELRDTTASTKLATSNIYQNRFVPVVVPELSKSTYTGYSATNWWMCCDPAILASAVVCFLNGAESPTIESAEADFDVLGIQFRGYHDFGVAMSEYRASVEAQA